MKLYRDVVCQMGKEQGCSPISFKIIETKEIVPLAKRRNAPTQTVTQLSAPWIGQQPYLKDIFAQAATQGAKPREFFPGQTYANFSPQTEKALNLTEQRAMAGSPVARSMNEELLKTLGGEYLYGGPGFNAAYQAAANKIIPQVQSGFNRGGRLNSGLAREAETRALADAFASQYEKERQNQLRAMLFAPEAAQMDYKDLAALAEVGGQREKMSQNAIDEAMKRHEFTQLEPSERLAKYLGMIHGTYGGEGAQTTTGFKGDRASQLLGGVLAGTNAGSPLLGLLAGLL